MINTEVKTFTNLKDLGSFEFHTYLKKVSKEGIKNSNLFVEKNKIVIFILNLNTYF